MARVSRKNNDKTKKVSSYRIWKTAIYARLSNINSGKEDDETLEVQIAYDRMNIDSKPDLELIDIYADNGFTGTNFERPEFERLLADIQMKRIDCIVVKDLSRFGRNFLDAGYYLEKLFPFLGVRFIAINDRYDSEASESQNGMTVPIKDMLNELYSRDLSVKIRKTWEQKRSRGEIYWPIPFGYRKDEENPGKLILDKEVAVFVKMIFDWKLKAISQREIASRLTELGVPIPFERRVQLGYVKDGDRVQREEWVTRDINRILRDPLYTGDMVYNRWAYARHYQNTGRENPREEWCITPNAHEPIITHEEYETVRRELKNKSAQYQKRRTENKRSLDKMPNVFEKILFCAECGHAMHHIRRVFHNRTRFTEYHCRHRKECENKHIIPARFLQILVMDQIRNQIQIGIDIEQMKKEWTATSEYAKKKAQLQNQQNMRQRVVDSFADKKRKAYEDFAEGLLNENEFMAVRQDIEEKAMKAKDYLEESKAEWEELKQLLQVEEHFQEFLKMNPEDLSFNENLMKTFIKRIEIDRDGALSIQFTIQNQVIRYLKIEELTK
ncbi:recombinase family protein [Hespellia stercorisuis]|uniref:Site-specific DNA recombinase n=1 Tax=Hespellia stercorisuis DSM 15480 TaxID=1121950 RepID=A0A1M6TJH7_9FIRM|nr:recombinase family protein [Hespellia stercorisuis]SHK57232.1 Site-specific DNA recombinase [Hespellia stercorisuis DSM 15480]